MAGSPGLKCRLCNELFWNNHVLVVWEVMKSEIESMSTVQFSEFHRVVIKENLGDPLLCLLAFQCWGNIRPRTEPMSAGRDGGSSTVLSWS